MLMDVTLTPVTMGLILTALKRRIGLSSYFTALETKMLSSVGNKLGANVLIDAGLM